MAADRDPVPRARHPGHWLGGLLVLGIVGAGLVAAALLLWENVDIRRLSRAIRVPEAALPTPLPPPVPAHAEVAYRAALFRSPASDAFFPDSAHRPRLLRFWEGLVEETGGAASVVSGVEGVDALGPETAVVAPAAVCLSSAEAEALRRHAERGGGVLLTWAAGARDASCEWAGWTTLRRLTGAPAVREVGERAAVYLAVPDGLPPAAGLDPASRIELRAEAQIALVGGGVRVFWSDWALNPAPAAGEEGADAAVWLRRADGGGRVAWYGFTADQAASAEDAARLRRLARGGLLWAAGLSTASLAPWPGGNRAALLVAEDVESEFRNAEALASLAKERGFPVTFFVLSRMALDHPELAGALGAAGEIGSQTSDHEVVAGLPYAEQLVRLRRSWQEIRGWSGDSARGLRPPEERFDSATLRAWRSLGGEYLAATNDGRSGSPELFGTPEGPVVLLPRVVEDDYNVIVQRARMRASELRGAFLDGARKVEALGGLAILSLHSQVGGTPERVRVVGEVVDSLRARGGWWLASGLEIARWWLARHGATVTARVTSEGVAAEVTAPPDRPLPDAWLRLTLPEGTEGREPTLDGSPVAYRSTPWGLEVPLGDLAAGESRTVRVGPIPEEGS